MSRTTLTDTLGRIQAQAAASAPLAKHAATSHPVAGDASVLRKVASALREEAEPALNYSDLYAVSRSGFRLPEAPVEGASYGSERGAGLRKVAHVIRLAHHEQQVKLAADAADTIVAAHGLTLLRDCLGSPR